MTLGSRRAALLVTVALGTGFVPALDHRLGAQDDQDGAVVRGLDTPPAPVARTALTQVERRRLLQLASWSAAPGDPTNLNAEVPTAARLGQVLFFDAGLSPDGQVSCASCHDPAQAFADGRPLAQGRVELTRNTPSLWNVAYQRWFFWDGRADTLWAQALEPLEEPRELGGDRLHIAHHIHGTAALRQAYESLFGAMPPLQERTRFPAHARPDPADSSQPHAMAWHAMSAADQALATGVFVNVGKVLAAYMRLLVTGPSPFDTYAQGLRDSPQGDDVEKLPSLPTGFSSEAERGARLFVGRAQCRFCHSGPLLTDGEFHNTFVPPLRPDLPPDPGRWRGLQRLRESPFNATGVHSAARDGPAAERVRSVLQGPHLWGAFKTPGLRGVARTAPYMHQGQLASLTDVVRFYSTLDTATGAGHHAETILVRLDLGEAEIRELVAFLESLTPREPPATLLSPLSTP